MDTQEMVDVVSDVVGKSCTVEIDFSKRAIIAKCFVFGHGTLAISSGYSAVAMSNFPAVMLLSTLEILGQRLGAEISKIGI